MDWLTIAIGIAGVLATLAAGFGVYWWSRRVARKALTFDYSAAKIAALDHHFMGNLKIVFAGNEVKDASLVSLTIRNAGGAPIQRSDFDTNLDFQFCDSTAILAVQGSEVKPLGLPLAFATPEQRANVVSVQPLLLNPGDEITLLALVDGFKGEIVPLARISGVKKIERGGQERTFYRSEFVVGLIAMAILMFGSFGLVYRGERHGYVFLMLGGFALGLLLGVLVLPTLDRRQ